VTTTQMLGGAAVLFICVLSATLAWALNRTPPIRPTPAATVALNLTATPTVVAVASATPTFTPTITVTTANVTPAPAAVTETATTGAPEVTSTIAPTWTPTGQTPTPRPIATTVTPVRATATPARPPTPLPAPVPSAPQERANVTGKTRFAWDYPGPLQPGQAFEVRIWAEGAEHLGAAEPVTILETTIDLEVAPGIVAKNKAEAGVYLWAVAVIEKATGARIGRESAPRHFTYSPGGCVGACR
jgi:hypothetical protein